MKEYRVSRFKSTFEDLNEHLATLAEEGWDVDILSTTHYNDESIDCVLFVAREVSRT